MRDPYELLAVSRSATAQDIKKAFRERAKRLHPDANNNNPKAAALFAELNAAHQILGDEEKRAAFDHGVIDAAGKPTRQMNANTNRSRRHILTCLILVVVTLATPLIMRTFTSGQRFNQNTDGKANIWPRLGAKEEHLHSAPTEQPGDEHVGASHLILQPSRYYITDGTVPLGTQVSGGAADLVLEIETGSDVARSDMSQESTTPARTGAYAMSQPDHGQIEFLLGRSQGLIPQLEAATLQPPAKVGAPRLATVLRATNDPIILSILQDRGVLAEVFLTSDLYKIPSGSNSRKIQKRLIAAWTPIESTPDVSVSNKTRDNAMPTPAAMRRVVHVPVQPLALPQARFEAHVEGTSADPSPPPLPPAFLR